MRGCFIGQVFGELVFYRLLLFSMASLIASWLYPRMMMPSTSIKGTALEPPLFCSISSLLLLSLSTLYSVRLTFRAWRNSLAFLQ